MKRLLSVLVGCALALVGVGYALVAPTIEQNKEIAEAPYWGYPNFSRLKSLSFVENDLEARVSEGDNPLVMFGSSEFSPGPSMTQPIRFFKNNNYGVDPMMVGRGFCLSLWHAMEMGALDEKIPQGKVVFFAGTTWFMQYQGHEGDYACSFSPSAYEAFMANPRLSDELKAEVNQSLIDYGVDYKLVNPSFDYAAPVRRIDAALGDYLGIARIEYAENIERSKLDHGYPYGKRHYDKEKIPNWEKIEEKALKQAQRQSTNDLQLLDDWYYSGAYDEYIKVLQEQSKQFEDDPWNTREFRDMEIFLKTCKELDIEPLVIIQPVNGKLWDDSVWNRKSRVKGYYEPVVALCEQYGVEYFDARDYEYTDYFFKDAVHPAWMGWLTFDKAIYEFSKQ